METGGVGTAGGTRVFLSYARPDAARAHALADILEARGFALWCDRQIEGGAVFAAEIEAELAAADAVLVLWSEAAVRSDWVRDEAAVGRDKGRLVPARLDKAPPPIGFRQHQSIDLSGWTGAPDDPALERLAHALSRTGAGQPHTHDPATAARHPVPWGLGAAGLAGVAAVAGMIAWHPWRAAPRAPPMPTVAVLPFEDMSNTPDGRAFSEGVAEEILNLIARDPGIHVLGRTSSAMLAANAGDPRRIERDLGVTHLLEGSVRSAPGRVKVGVRLVALPGDRSVFAQQFDRQLTDIFAVQSEIGQAVAARLGGALGPKAAAGGATGAPRTTPEVYTRWLAARQLLRTRQPAEMARAQALLTEAIKADPNYAPAFAGLAEVSVLLAADQYGQVPVSRAIAAARGYAARAAALAPDLAESRAALGMAAIEAGEGAQAVDEFRRAVALDPHRVETLNWLGYALNQTGELTEAAKVMRQAVALEPLWFRPRVTAMYTLHLIGADAEIAAMAQSFVAIAPDPLAADRVNMAAALQLGRNAEAATIAARLLATSPGDPQAVETLSTVGTNLYRFDLAFKTLGSPASIFGDLLRGDPAGAAARAVKMGPAIWQSNEDRYYGVTALGARANWAGLVALYDAQRSTPERWLGTTTDINLLDVAPMVALALDHEGRAGEARRLRAQTASRLRFLEQRGLSQVSSAWLWAVLLAGTDRASAIRRLDLGSAGGNPALICAGPTHLDRSPELAALASDPRFKALVVRCDRWAQNQRDALAKAGL